MHVDTKKPLLTQKKQYQDFVKRVRPSPAILRNALVAFAAGGAITLAGQIILTLFEGRLGMPLFEAASATFVVLILAAQVLTATGLYDEGARWAGAGLIVPITGLANAMAASAMESRREGFVVGVGANMFATAGPVILFGTLFSWLAGIIYYSFR